MVLEPRPPSVPEIVEDGETLVDNARLKARALSHATRRPAVADDTGLEVAALGGAPGVYSARFAGHHATYADNVRKLLVELERAGAASADQRSATFRTVALIAYPDGSEQWAEGTVDGTIAMEPAGTSGFGYDPVFVPDGAGGRTFAEMTVAEKHQVSHRGRAFRALADQLQVESA